MKKMKTLFVKDENHHATPTIQCEWVFDAGVKAYIKRDGTACMIKDGALYKRYDAKKNRKTGEYKTPPLYSIPCCDPDEITGHWPHWVMCDYPDRWHMEALERGMKDGTYELCGPKINGNPERLHDHFLIDHKSEEVFPPLSFDAIRDYLNGFAYEGIVYHHPDGRMCKVRRKDFGLDWPIKTERQQ